jgi:hypothetical protein
MRPVSFAVLAVAALLTSPALGAAATGDLPVDVALTRYLLAAGACWLLLSVASEWLWPAPAPASSTSQPPSSPGVTDVTNTADAAGSAPEPGRSVDPVPAPVPASDAV